METKPHAQRQIHDAFALVVKRFPPVLCEAHFPAWSRYSLFCDPDPLWFVVWDPKGVEYDWHHTDASVTVRWVPGSPPQVFLTVTEAGALLGGVDMASRVAELETQLCRQLGKVDPVEAQKVILSLDEALTEVYEHRAVPHASDCFG